MALEVGRGGKPAPPNSSSVNTCFREHGWPNAGPRLPQCFAQHRRCRPSRHTGACMQLRATSRRCISKHHIPPPRPFAPLALRTLWQRSHPSTLARQSGRSRATCHNLCKPPPPPPAAAHRRHGLRCHRRCCRRSSSSSHRHQPATAPSHQLAISRQLPAASQQPAAGNQQKPATTFDLYRPYKRIGVALNLSKDRQDLGHPDRTGRCCWPGKAVALRCRWMPTVC